jgi:hypothetical protein
MSLKKKAIVKIKAAKAIKLNNPELFKFPSMLALNGPIDWQRLD